MVEVPNRAARCMAFSISSTVEVAPKRAARALRFSSSDCRFEVERLAEKVDGLDAGSGALMLVECVVVEGSVEGAGGAGTVGGGVSLWGLWEGVEDIATYLQVRRRDQLVSLV